METSKESMGFTVLTKKLYLIANHNSDWVKGCIMAGLLFYIMRR